MLCVFIATLTIVSSYASADNKLKLTEKQFKKLQSKLAYIDYAITANNAIALEKDRTKWYTNDKYRKSIINEIGFAIEKCLLGNEKDGNGIVIFYKGMTPKNFTQANYNAWLLYNYVDTVITDKADVTLQDVADKIRSQYTIEDSKMDKAIKDIGKYTDIECVQDMINKYKYGLSEWKSTNCLEILHHTGQGRQKGFDISMYNMYYELL